MNIPESTANSSAKIFPPSHPVYSVKLENTSSPSTAEKVIEQLQKDYQHIHFDVVDFKNNDQIKKYASLQDRINNVTISKQLLEKMASDQTLYTKIEEILNSLSKYQSSSLTEAYLTDKKLTGMGLIIDENGEVTKWTATEALPQETQFSPNKEEFPWKTNTNSTTKKKKDDLVPYKYSQSYNMMRLASAKSIPAVRGLIASSYSEISKVKLKVSDSKEASLIIRKIKSVIQNSNIKIARLHREEHLFRAERIAEKKRKIMLERQLEEQLRKKKTARKAQEHCQTACFDDIFAKPSINDERYRQITEHYAAVSSAAIPMNSLSALPTAVSASAASTEIDVAPAITIDCSA